MVSVRVLPAAPTQQHVQTENSNHPPVCVGVTVVETETVCVCLHAFMWAGCYSVADHVCLTTMTFAVHRPHSDKHCE